MIIMNYARANINESFEWMFQWIIRTSINDLTVWASNIKLFE